MSYLIRNGTGRNSITYGGGTNVAAKYLRRTGTGRTNISWIDISSIYVARTWSSTYGCFFLGFTK